MEIVSIHQAAAQLLNLLEKVNQDHLPREISSDSGNAVLLSKEDWNSIQETLYLQAVPGLVQAVRAAEQEDDWVSEDEFLEHLNGVDNHL